MMESSTTKRAARDRWLGWIWWTISALVAGIVANIAAWYTQAAVLGWTGVSGALASDPQLPAVALLSLLLAGAAGGLAAGGVVWLAGRIVASWQPTARGWLLRWVLIGAGLSLVWYLVLLGIDTTYRYGGAYLYERALLDIRLGPSALSGLVTALLVGAPRPPTGRA